jgi:hypothetical protein
VNRIGRRTIIAMLLIVALVVIWQVFASAWDSQRLPGGRPLITLKPNPPACVGGMPQAIPLPRTLRWEVPPSSASPTSA